MIRGALALVTLALATQAGAEAGGDATRGAEIFRQCAGCHEVGQGADHGIGPHLNHIFDRAAGHAEGYSYSPGLARAAANGLVWDFDNLDAYLTNPRIMVSGTRMTFPGLSDPQARDDVLAYLRQFSDDPQNIPEAAPTAEAHPHDLDPEILAIVGDPAYGEYLSGECTSCHQEDGDANGIPAIVGWPQDQFVMALHAYKTGFRDHPVMQMMARRLANEEIAALAAYFETLDQQ